MHQQMKQQFYALAWGSIGGMFISDLLISFSPLSNKPPIHGLACTHITYREVGRLQLRGAHLTFFG